LGYILGDFFTNSSGHPDAHAHFDHFTVFDGGRRSSRAKKRERGNKQTSEKKDTGMVTHDVGKV
jgi:hypothetical protein